MFSLAWRTCVIACSATARPSSHSRGSAERHLATYPSSSSVHWSRSTSKLRFCDLRISSRWKMCSAPSCKYCSPPTSQGDFLATMPDGNESSWSMRATLSPHTRQLGFSGRRSGFSVTASNANARSTTGSAATLTCHSEDHVQKRLGRRAEPYAMPELARIRAASHWS